MAAALQLTQRASQRAAPRRICQIWPPPPPPLRHLRPSRAAAAAPARTMDRDKKLTSSINKDGYVSPVWAGN